MEKKFNRKNKPAAPETPFEHILLSSYKQGMISYVHSHPEAYSEAVSLAVSDKQPYSWRAAQLLWSCIEPDDLRIRKHLKKIISYLPFAVDNQKSQLLKILLLMKIPNNLGGLVLDESISCWKDITKMPSLRYRALVLILTIAKRFPELSHEISLLHNEHYFSTFSPGVKRSAERLFREANL